MEFVPYLLVLISAFTHAYWNFVLKRANGGHAFIALSKLAEIVLFAIPFVYIVAKSGVDLFANWLFYAVGAILVILNYLFLGHAYKHADLSIVYPVSRAGSLLFLPALAFLFLGESIDFTGSIAIGLIIVGLFSMQLEAFSRRDVLTAFASFVTPGTLSALLAAFTAACYTLWDKHSLTYLPPFVYFYSYTVIVGAAYAAFVLVKIPSETIKAELAGHKLSIVKVGFLNTFTYLLVLYSLQSGKASYVIAVRQLSIGFGVFLGWKFLGETLPLPKKAGVGLLVAGCILISLAR